MYLPSAAGFRYNLAPVVVWEEQRLLSQPKVAGRAVPSPAAHSGYSLISTNGGFARPTANVRRRNCRLGYHLELNR
jgi:hypothetical protein